jgi:hypothetical protein
MFSNLQSKRVPLSLTLKPPDLQAMFEHFVFIPDHTDTNTLFIYGQGTEGNNHASSSTQQNLILLQSRSQYPTMKVILPIFMLIRNGAQNTTSSMRSEASSVLLGDIHCGPSHEPLNGPPTRATNANSPRSQYIVSLVVKHASLLSISECSIALNSIRSSITV